MRSSYKTGFVTPIEYEEAIFKIADEIKCVNDKKPERFKRLMYTNRGNINILSPFPVPEDGLEPKNPLIVGLGDSVTAGKFESTCETPEEFQAHIKKMTEGTIGENDIGEVSDIGNSYLTKFWQAVADYYQNTALSVINSGIAGDNVMGMLKRLDRDVIRYQPDLVTINPALNWDEHMGVCEVFASHLDKIVERIKNETDADIILMTPNLMVVPRPDMENHVCSLEERVAVIRDLAVKYDTSLADTYAVWQEYEKQGYPVKPMLANGFNHPSEAGHRLFAKVLMKVVE
ncbi:MAG: GDSL-type esterase/lipase family protein [Lachnospiraceae bacterium]|nr:GDSL-type esterase/lipase family protein [Lachnospiraceae bacterium]